MRNIQLFCAVLFLLHGMTAFAFDGDVVDPVIPDKLERVILDGRELGGEINRRICDLIYKNYMVLDLDKDWIDHFRNREDRHDAIGVYYGVGKVIDAGTLFARYTNDEKVAARTQYLIDEIVKTRDADGYIGFWNREPNDRQNFINWILHEQEYFTLALTRDYRMTGNPESLESAKIMADHIIRTFPKNEEGVYYIPSPISIAGVAEAAVELYRISGDEKYLDFAQNLQYEPHWFYEPFDQWRARINERGFHQYVMLSHLYPETELYRLTGDETRLLKSDWMRHALLEKDYGALLVTGSSSNGEQFTRDQYGTGNIEESCVTAYLLRFFDSLLRLEGDLRYGDIMERTIYNAL
ncbi:MAG: glycoside hydrolase family 127 protein, partial [Thermoguttaceae bacterium]|nr:glycoside hydrolase family 127 protein [Thermoguttaceae bacterium]